MQTERFLHRCRRGLWHVGPPGSWARMQIAGFRTAQQLIDAATLDPRGRADLTDRPRRESVVLAVAGDRVELADQNTGAIARRSDPYKRWDTFRSVAAFPDERPKGDHGAGRADTGRAPSRGHGGPAVRR